MRISILKLETKFHFLQVLYEALHSFRMTKRPLWDHLKSKVIVEILNKLPLFVNKTVREVLFGYSDETVEQIPKIRKIFEQYGLELKVNEYIRDGQFSIINSVRKFTCDFRIHKLFPGCY